MWLRQKTVALNLNNQVFKFELFQHYKIYNKFIMAWWMNVCTYLFLSNATVFYFRNEGK